MITDFSGQMTTPMFFDNNLLECQYLQWSIYIGNVYIHMYILYSFTKDITLCSKIVNPFFCAAVVVLNIKWLWKINLVEIGGDSSEVERRNESMKRVPRMGSMEQRAVERKMREGS